MSAAAPDAPREQRWREGLRVALVLASAPRATAALMIAIVLFSFGAGTVRALIGRAGEIGMMAALLALCALSLAGARDRPRWQDALPVSLVALLGWLSLSTLWSEYTWASVNGTVTALAWAALGVFLATAGDPIQLIRAVGDAMRILLGASFVAEIVSGVLLDAPITALGIRGDLAVGGPVQGVVQSRNLLGLIALLALVTFAIEVATRSVTPVLAVISVSGAALALVLTRSPVTFIAALATGVAAVVLILLRRASDELRPWLQLGVGLLLALLVAVIAALRGPLIALLSAGSEIEVRLDLWQRMLRRLNLGGSALIGEGWVGPWNTSVVPYRVFSLELGRTQSTGLSSYVDMLFQTGVAGLLIMLVALGLAMWRAWSVASAHRSRTLLWPVLVLVPLVVTGFAESYLLTGGGLVLLVAVGTLVAARMSWRQRVRS